jgi:membrane protein DedA with SNARE-associated domain
LPAGCLPRGGAFVALGAAVWVAVWTSFGYVAGGHLGEIYEQVLRYQILVLVGIGGAILAFVAHWLWRRQRHSFVATRSGQ